jgi:uncharacterized protein YggT (Ycf19 family)
MVKFREKTFTADLGMLDLSPAVANLLLKMGGEQVHTHTPVARCMGWVVSFPKILTF